MLDAVMQRDGETLTFHLTVMAKQEGRQWSAWCPELEVAAQGDTMQDAVEALHDTVDVYIRHMMKGGREGEIVRPAPAEAYHEFLTAARNGSHQSVQVSSRALELSFV
jgi:predicted RNase H-like HicB family nuclease